MFTRSGDQIEIATFRASRRALVNYWYKVNLAWGPYSAAFGDTGGAQRTFDQFQVGKGALATAVAYHHT